MPLAILCCRRHFWRSSFVSSNRQQTLQHMVFSSFIVLPCSRECGRGTASLLHIGDGTSDHSQARLMAATIPFYGKRNRYLCLTSWDNRGFYHWCTKQANIVWPNSNLNLTSRKQSAGGRQRSAHINASSAPMQDSGKRHRSGSITAQSCAGLTVSCPPPPFVRCLSDE